MWWEQKSGTRGVAECVTDVLTTFWRLLWSITESDARQHGIYLFYIITQSLFYFKMFQHNAKAGLLPRLCTKKSHLTHLTWSDWYKMKQFHWLLCVAKNCDWSTKIASLSNLTRASLLVAWKRTAKAELTAKSTNLEENAGKIKSVFVIGAALWAKKLGRCLENYGSWKNTLGKLVVAFNLEAVWFEFWMKGA